MPQDPYISTPGNREFYERSLRTESGRKTAQMVDDWIMQGLEIKIKHHGYIPTEEERKKLEDWHAERKRNGRENENLVDYRPN